MPISLDRYVATACKQVGHISQVLAGTVHLLSGYGKTKGKDWKVKGGGCMPDKLQGAARSGRAREGSWTHLV